MSPGLLPTTRPPPRALYHVQCPRTRRPPPLAFCMKRRPIIAAVTVSYAIGGITLVEVLSCCSHGRCQRARVGSTSSHGIGRGSLKPILPKLNHSLQNMEAPSLTWAWV